MKRCTGFTLFELVIVLAIIAAMVTVVAPYASRSNESLKLSNQCEEIAETLNYAIQHVAVNNQKGRFCLDTSRKAFYLETAGEEGHFSSMTGSIGQTRYLSPNCHLTEIEGFEMEGQRCYLEFDPMRKWPSGQFVVLGKDFRRMIKIESKTVTIIDQADM